MHQELFKNRKYASALKWNLQFELFFCCRLWDLELCHIIQCINTKSEVLAHRNRSWERLRLCRSISEQATTHVIPGRQLHSTNHTWHQGKLSCKTHTHVEEILSSFFFFLLTRFILDFCQFHTTAEPVMIFCSVCGWHKGWDLVWDFRYHLAGIYLCATWVWSVEMKSSVKVLDHKFSVPLEMLQAVLAGLQLLLQESTNLL